MKTALMMTLALLCMAAPLLAQKTPPPPLFDAKGIPTAELTSSFITEWTNPKREKEKLLFHVHMNFPKLSDNDRRRYSKSERAPFTISIHLTKEAPNDSRVTVIYEGQTTSTTDKRPTTLYSSEKAMINFMLVDENNNVVKKMMSVDSTKFQPFRDEAKFGNYTLFAWTKHYNGMFGVVTNFTLYVPPVEPTITPKK